MEQSEIIRMAREAGSIDSEDVILTIYAAFAAHEREKDRLMNYAAIQMAIAGEREACAKVCEDINNPTFEAVAAAIRARNNND